MTITGVGAAVFSQTNTCGGAVGAAASCVITVSFQPVAVGSSPTADLLIADSSVDSPQVVQLKGKGAAQLAAAIRSALSASPASVTPVPTGSNGVGTSVIRFVDPSRRDPYVATATRRELLVRFWYPASLVLGCRPAEYTSPRVWSYFSDLAGIPLPAVTTNSCFEPPVADGSHPIVVFTHGYTGTFTDYTFLFEDLASRGYVVVSVDHTYEATAVEFPDGRFFESIAGSHLANIAGNDERELAFAVDVRLGDLKTVANQLELLNASAGSPFAGKLDTAHMAIAGHSLGGLTAILSLEREPRFKAAVILDGVVPDDLVGAIERPVLILLAGHSHRDWSSSELRLWNKLRGVRFLVNVQGAEHLTPTDLVWLAKGAIRTGTMGPEKTIAAFRNYVAGFLDANLRGQPIDSLLNGMSHEFPDVELTTPLQSLPNEK